MHHRQCTHTIPLSAHFYQLPAPTSNAFSYKFCVQFVHAFRVGCNCLCCTFPLFIYYYFVFRSLSLSLFLPVERLHIAVGAMRNWPEIQRKHSQDVRIAKQKQNINDALWWQSALVRHITILYQYLDVWEQQWMKIIAFFGNLIVWCHCLIDLGQHD